MNKYSSIWIKKFRKDLLIASIIVIIPFSSFLHLFADTEQNSIAFLGIEFNHNFDSNNAFVWSVFANLIPLILISIMFLTLRYRIRYCLFLFFYFIISTSICQYFISYNSYLDFVISIQGFILAIIIVDWMCIIDRSIKKEFRELIIRLSSKDLINEWIHKRSNRLNNQINNSLRKRSTIKLKHLAQLYHLQRIVKNNYHSSTSDKEESNHQIDLKNWIFGGLLVLAGLLVYLDNFIPSNNNFKFESFGFKNFQIFVWYITQKLSMIIILAVWFVSNPHWWRYALLSPLVLYLYQFWETFQGLETVEDYENARVFPLVFLTIVFIMLLSKVIRRRSRTLDYKDYLQEELDKGIEVLSRRAMKH